MDGQLVGASRPREETPCLLRQDRRRGRKVATRNRTIGTARKALWMLAALAPVVGAGAATAGEVPETGQPEKAIPVAETDATAGGLDYSFPEGGLQLYRSREDGERLTVGGEILGRVAHWNWYEGPSGDNEYDYAFQRTRLNLTYTSPSWTVFVQPQYVHFSGVPSDAFKAPPEGPLGMGGLYYIHNDDTEPRDFGFHQGYVQLRSRGDHALSLKLGRFEYSDGLEVLEPSDGKHFNALKKIRLGDRLISPFGWSAFGRSFDGTIGQYDRPNLNVTASFFYPTQGGWEEDIDDTMEDIKIITLTVTGKRGTLIPGMEVAGFYYNYQDDRDVAQRVDNTGRGWAPHGADIDIHMVGGHAVGTYDVGPGTADVLLWGGGQFGNWYDLDHEAYALAAEAGYQVTDVFAKPWVRAGYYVGSGDGNPTDGDHETFFQMAPGTRKYNLLPYCDLMNINDAFVQVILYPTKELMVRTDYHFLRLNDEDDRWYMGSGPTQENRIFGYIGRPTGGDRDLAQELDVMVQYQVSPHCKIIASYSHIFGDDVVHGVYGKDEDADYFSVEVLLNF